ncbi:unnamed protein product [Mytilus coruscus]|uniref:Uncharacterized protein n=1 Tax=Mytilus coruscus TaxID=42192 RepID=A0A6J8AS13_MYTCO|nr:unnamed protein product [Mytilus coruscus]
MISYKSHYSFQYIKPNVVLAAVHWLKANNHLYQSATVNEDWVSESMADDKDMWEDITENETAQHDSENVDDSNVPQDTPSTNTPSPSALITDTPSSALIRNTPSTSALIRETSSTSALITDTPSTKVESQVQSIHGNVDALTDENDYTDDPVAKLRGVRSDTCIQSTDQATVVDKILSISPEKAGYQYMYSWMNILRNMLSFIFFVLESMDGIMNNKIDCKEVFSTENSE